MAIITREVHRIRAHNDEGPAAGRPQGIVPLSYIREMVIPRYLVDHKTKGALRSHRHQLKGVVLQITEVKRNPGWKTMSFES